MIKLLTLNAYGLKYISKHRHERLRAIGDSLAHGDYDVVALQEVWVEEDWKYIDHVCRELFPYRRIFRLGIISGPGLAILLKIPIKSTFLYRFPINGRPSAFFRGDWYVGKSIAITVLEPLAPNLPPVAVMNSHMHAPYASRGDAAYATHRACQAWDLAKLVCTLKMAGYAVVQVGDLNSRPGSLPHRLFTIEGDLADSWEVLMGQNIPLAEELARMTPEDQITKGGITCNSVLNTWSAHRNPWEACRLDYALIDTRTLTPVLAGVQFTEKLAPPYSCSVSDHFGYTVELNVHEKLPSSHETDTEELLNLYTEALMEVRNYLNTTIPRQTGWRKLHFFFSIVAVIAMHIGVTYIQSLSHWQAIIFSLTSTIVALSGLLNGLIWGFGVRSELRALQEVKMEIEDAIKGLRLKKE